MEPQSTGIELQSSSQTPNVNVDNTEAPYHELDKSAMQPQPEHQTTSTVDNNINDETYLQPIIPPPQSNDHGNVDDNEAPYLDLDESVLQPQPAHRTTSSRDNSNTNDGASLLPMMIPHPPSENSDEYEYVHDPDAVLTDEEPYMDLDASSRQPESVYQEVTNPDKLKDSDTYLTLDPNSRSAETEYQALDTRGQDSDPTYATAI